MPLNPMNLHYAMENPASVYDEEAMSALELAGRQGKKINELVEAYNSLETQTGNQLAEQNQAIDNIRDKTVPAEVKAECIRLMESGEFDQAINLYLDNLNGRVDALLGKVVTGSTTGDAELIDARMDVLGNTWANAGNNIRAMQKQTQAYMDTLTMPILENVSKERNVGWYGANGAFVNDEQYRSFVVDVHPGEVYYLKTIYGYDVYGALCADSSGNIIKRYFQSSTPKSEEFTTPIVIPENGARLYVNGQPDASNQNYYQYYLPILLKVANFTLNTNALTEYLDSFMETMSKGNPIYQSVGTSANELLMEDGRPSATPATKYTVITAEVKPGETYRINAQANYQKYTWVMYNNADYPCIFGPQAGNPDDVYVTDKVVTIPMGVRYIRVAGVYGSGKLEKLVERNPSTLDVWSHLKWCCVGDSLTEVNERTTKHYFDYIQEKTGIEVVNMGLSGSGYKRKDDSNQAFYQRIVNVPTDCDVVTIFGSGNDGGAGTLGNPTDTGTNTVCGCINTTLDKLYEIMPTVQVGVVSPSPWGWQTPDDESCFMYKYSNALKAICERRGIPFLNLFRLSGFRTMKNGAVNAQTHDLLFSNDPEGNCTHPNELGHKILSSHFYTFMQSLIGTY